MTHGTGFSSPYLPLTAQRDGATIFREEHDRSCMVSIKKIEGIAYVFIFSDGMGRGNIFAVENPNDEQIEKLKEQLSSFSRQQIEVCVDKNTIRPLSGTPERPVTPQSMIKALDNFLRQDR